MASEEEERWHSLQIITGGTVLISDVPMIIRGVAG